MYTGDLHEQRRQGLLQRHIPAHAVAMPLPWRRASPLSVVALVCVASFAKCDLLAELCTGFSHAYVVPNGGVPSLRPQRIGIAGCSGSRAHRYLSAGGDANQPIPAPSGSSASLTTPRSVECARVAYVVAAIGLLWSPRRSFLEACARTATVLLTLVDFAPTASRQLAESAAALRFTNGAVGLRWAILVRAKIAGEFLGLAMMWWPSFSTRVSLTWWPRWPTCFGASFLLASHMLFWIFGAAAARVDSQGKPAPLPALVARIVLGADTVVFGAALTGWSAPSPLGRTVGTAAYAVAVSLVCANEMSGRLAGRGQNVGRGRDRESAADVAARRSCSQSDPRGDSGARSGILRRARDGEGGWDAFSWRQQWSA